MFEGTSSMANASGSSRSTTSQQTAGRRTTTPRILFVDQCAALGGGELSLLDIARAWSQSSEVVLLEDGPFRDRLETEDISVSVESIAGQLSGVSRTDGFWTSLGAIPTLLSLVWRLARRARSFDLIYANSQKAMVAGSLAGWLANRPVLWHLRDLLTREHLSASHRRVAVGLANTFLTKVVCNSRATREAFVDAGGHRDLSTVVYNGIDAASFESGVNSLDQRRTLGLPASAPIVGVFSRLAPWKGQHVLLEALPTLQDVHAIIVGDALFEDDQEYAMSLRETAVKLDIAERVHFLGFREDVAALMNLVDVVAHTSTAPEPFGRVIVESMLAETPIVATAGGGASEIVTSGHNGLLVAPADPTALGNALSTLFTSPPYAKRLARAGRTTAVTRFSRESMLNGIRTQVHAAITK